MDLVAVHAEGHGQRADVRADVEFDDGLLLPHNGRTFGGRAALPRRPDYRVAPNRRSTAASSDFFRLFAM